MKEPNKSKNYNADGGSNVRAMTAVLRGGDSRKNPLNKKPFLARSKVALTTIVWFISFPFPVSPENHSAENKENHTWENKLTEMSYILHAFPLLYLNLGGELLYIIEQRLQAQNIVTEKSEKGEMKLL